MCHDISGNFLTTISFRKRYVTRTTIKGNDDHLWNGGAAAADDEKAADDDHEPR